MSSEKKSYSKALAEIRTLLALERNYLAEERTVLAELRTGLALTILGPVFSVISFALQNPNFWIFILLSMFLIITIIGLIIIFNSRKKLKTIRKNKTQIHQKEEKIINDYDGIKSLLIDAMDPYCEIDPSVDYKSPFSSKYE